jgi:hypothetical protein
MYAAKDGMMPLPAKTIKSAGTQQTGSMIRGPADARVLFIMADSL